MKVAIIGAGNMGASIARGLARGTIVPAADIIVSNPSVPKLDSLRADYPDIVTTTDNRAAATGTDLVILAVKPYLVPTVLKELKLKSRQVLASVAAGVPFERLAHSVADKDMTMFRIIPNMAISERQSMTLIASRNATHEQEQLMLDIFNEMGLSLFLPEEKFAAATSVASCGTAYALKYVQAAMQAAVELGIRPADGITLAAQCLKGAAELLLNNPGSHPALEIDKVCTPGGITIRGINELEHGGFTSTVIRAIKASAE